MCIALAHISIETFCGNCGLPAEEGFAECGKCLDDGIEARLEERGDE